MGREVKLKDLAVVCANCHVMIHMGGFTVDF
jgi:predicted HNH restriction endonuclease